MNRAQLIRELTEIVGPAGILHQPEEILVYDYDASFQTHPPDVVVLPTTTAQVGRIARIAAHHGLPLVARGAGTGLSSGSVPVQGGILLALTRMHRIKSVDLPNRQAVVEAGVLNLDLVNHLAPHGYTYAPDPSSGKACTIGGNIGANAGGPHCLAYGVTANHVLGLEAVLADGTVIQTGGPLTDYPGYDLTGVLVGSEGTLGIVTQATVRLMPLPETAQTLLVIFQTIEDASAAVSDIIAHGIIPTAMEMMDGLVCRAVEAAFHAGYPADAAGVLLIEVEGLADGLPRTMAQITAVCEAHHATEIRQATTAAERAALWAGRKGALGSMGRIAPNYYLEDGVVPRHKLPRMMAFVGEVAQKYNLPIGNFFHAGDGNIHPTILFDRRDPAALARAHQAAEEIVHHCIALGGTISGEHGIGLEKQRFMGHLYNQDDLTAMADLKACFDPEGRLNPGKIFPTDFHPTPAANAPFQILSPDRVAARLESIVGAEYLLTADAAGAYQLDDVSPAFVAQPGRVAEVSALLRLATELNLAVTPWGGGTRRLLGNTPARLELVISLARLNQVLEHIPSDLTAAVQAGCSLNGANAVLGQAGQMLPLDVPLSSRSTLGGIVAAGPLATGLRRLAYGTVKDMLLGIETVRADGRVTRWGGMVVKNVAGYDMARLQVGALGTLGLITQVNLKVQPRPEQSGALLAGFNRWPEAAPFTARLLRSSLQPATAALCSGELLTDAPGPVNLLLRFDGRAEAVERQLRDASAWLNDTPAAGLTVWDEAALDQTWPALVNFSQQADLLPGEALFRLNGLPATVKEVASAVSAQSTALGLTSTLLVDAALGVIWLRTAGDAASLRTLYGQLGRQWPSTVLAAAPAVIKQNLNVWGQSPSAAAVMQRLKSRFDPHALLNPGRYLPLTERS